MPETPYDSPQAPPTTIVYAQPPRQGLLRTLLSTLFRGLLTLVVIIITVAVGVGFLVALSGQAGPLPDAYRPGFGPTEVSILQIDSVITGEEAEFVRTAVNTILENDSVKAVVLRVDSPGGEVTASDQIWRQIQRLKDDGITVVASYGAVAASGGYYISCHADSIVAEPTTITGSIGVIMNALTFEDLLAKIGVDPVVLVAEQSPDKALANTIYRDWTEEDLAVMRDLLDGTYEIFFDRVYQGRKHVVADESVMRNVADGSIYMADDAMTAGLVDSIGYLDDAVDLAIQLSGAAPDTPVNRYKPWEPPFQLPLALKANAANASRSPQLPSTPAEWRLWWYELNRPKAMYLFDLN
ncbi:MAG: signal peptide peptidase SppA [Phycisphaerales bacterium]